METSVTEAVMLRLHLYPDSHERMKHLREILSLADGLHRPAAEVAQLYEDVLEDLSAHAQVPDFLLVLVSKKVRELCRRKS
jgi:hypothetical protein